MKNLEQQRDNVSKDILIAKQQLNATEKLLEMLKDRKKVTFSSYLANRRRDAGLFCWTGLSLDLCYPDLMNNPAFWNVPKIFRFVDNSLFFWPDRNTSSWRHSWTGQRRSSATE